MTIPIRSIPVLEGEVLRRFEREVRKAEKNRGTIDFTEQMKSYRAIVKRARELGML
jgi:hypothetical protein